MQMFLTKKTAYAIAVLTLGVFGTIWILSDARTTENNPLVSIESSGTNASGASLFATLTPPNGNQTGQIAGATDIANSENITENVVKAYGARILDQNQKGSGSGGISVPTQDTLNSILADQLESTPLTIPTYSVRDIRTSSHSPTKEELVAYFKSLVTSYTNEFKSVKGNYFVAVVDAFSSGRTTDIQTHLDAASRFINALLTMQVPNGWSAFHVELLNLWQARLSLGSIIANGSDDPFKAYLAVTKFSETSAQEDLLLARLQREMTAVGITKTP